jgi:solute carrier family 41
MLNIPSYLPDIYCLPYVSSMVDVIGQLLLVCAFAVASSFGDKITSVVGQPDAP